MTIEARWLYVTILLSGDDIGLFEATPFRLARNADLKREHADKLVSQLVDADLIRTYQVAGRKLGFIPKYGQRLQIKRTKYPLPPRALLADDPDALLKFDEICKKLAKNNSEENQRSNPKSSGDPRKSTVDHSNPPPEPEPDPEQRQRKDPPALRDRPPLAPQIARPDDVGQQVWDDWCKHREKKRATITKTVIDGLRERGIESGYTLEGVMKFVVAAGTQGFFPPKKTGGYKSNADKCDETLEQYRREQKQLTIDIENEYGQRDIR